MTAVVVPKRQRQRVSLTLVHPNVVFRRGLRRIPVNTKVQVNGQDRQNDSYRLARLHVNLWRHPVEQKVRQWARRVNVHPVVARRVADLRTRRIRAIA